jgi:hypothetical protein
MPKLEIPAEYLWKKRRKTKQNKTKQLMHISPILLTNNREIVSIKKKFENKSFFTRILGM